MTLPIGSGFFTGDIPGRVIPAKGVTARPQGLADQAAAQKTNTCLLYTSPSPRDRG